MSRLIALCDASFCPNNKFAYLGYRIFHVDRKPYITSNIWLSYPSTCGQAEKFALKKLIAYLYQTDLIKQTTLFSDRLQLVESMKKQGLDIRHIQGHKAFEKRNWIDWQFADLDCELRKLLREAR